jgi:GNAT superfamily N-acetyltransferase
MDVHEILGSYTYWQRIQIETPGMTKEAHPHLVRFLRPAPGMSFISYSRLDETNADAVIAGQVSYFREHQQPFSWKVYGYDTPPDLAARLEAQGGEISEEEDVMVLELDDLPASLSRTVHGDVRRLTQPEQLNDVIRVEEQVWGGNFAWIRERLGSHLAIPGYLSVYAAYAAGQPVCAAWIYFHAGSPFADLWGGSTLPAYRQQGFYTALLAARVQEARRRGFRFVTIDAGPMSAPIVRRHGFRLLATARDCDFEFTP